ncbi:unnamed protein product [Chrysoparadoxa australica]
MRGLWVLLVGSLVVGTQAFAPLAPLNTGGKPHVQNHYPATARFANSDVEETTEKYGLEAGLFSVLKSDESKESKGMQAKDLLARYGSAYLITSISFAAVSFATCYFLVDNGIDVSSLLTKVGITATGSSEKVGTVAIAYTAHKAASPIRFPPTVALTPVVAKWLGQQGANSEEGEED